MKPKHIIESQQFDRDFLENQLFPLADRMEKIVKEKWGWSFFRYFFARRALVGKKMVVLFYEPSTRTRISFEVAMKALGGEVISSTESARQFSSAYKGETLEDTIRVLNGYHPDVIILRYDEEGGAKRAAEVSQVSVINAGDGKGQHPTQSLTDLYTIKKEKGRIDGLTFVIDGDLARGRTVHSLSYLLGKFTNITIHYVAPKVLWIGENIKDYLKKHGVYFTEGNDLRIVAPKADVIYQTRTQSERNLDVDRTDLVQKHDPEKGYYVVDKEVLKLMKPDAIILHPLPRVAEITTEVDSDPRAAYFRQAENGLYIRMALLKLLLKPKRNWRFWRNAKG